MRRDKTLRSNYENLHAITILDGEHSHANGIFRTQVLTEIEALEVITEVPYNSTTIY